MTTNHTWEVTAAASTPRSGELTEDFGAMTIGDGVICAASLAVAFAFGLGCGWWVWA